MKFLILLQIFLKDVSGEIGIVNKLFDEDCLQIVDSRVTAQPLEGNLEMNQIVF